MNIHICTEDTFFIDALKGKIKCWICNIECEHEFGWVGVRCSNCGSVWELEMTMPDIVRMQREKLLKMTRRELADKLGYSIKTIQQYEFVKVSQKYINRLNVLIN